MLNASMRARSASDQPTFTPTNVYRLEYSQRVKLCDLASHSFKDLSMDPYLSDGEESPKKSGLLAVVRVIKPLRLFRLVRILKLLNHRAIKSIKEQVPFLHILARTQFACVCRAVS